ncbi:MAG: isoaspartyl peptidase/L-asparaginase [Planctomycetes bacterium]|nr:isoaspartyl peptidase/L-asparaginase [Planctomycetota bacterium]
MRRFLVGCLLMLTSHAPASAQEPAVPNVVLGIHGGVGVLKKEMTPELEKQIRAGLDAALKAGYAALQKPNATSLDAVEAAIRVLEDDPSFNAGRGAVFTHEGKNELDASIMEGQNRKAGAVAGVTTVKNPITAARAVMEKSKHVMMVSRGAEKFAQDIQLEIVDPSYFWTEHRWKDLLERLTPQEREALEKKGQKTGAGLSPARLRLDEPREWSTVGAVAIDRQGNLAAGTSTGGMTNKRFGRIGDSPVIGAGTYADNASGAVSCTGHGEYFIRYTVARDITLLMEYKGLSVKDAADTVIRDKLEKAGGEGAAIVLDRKGNFVTSRNTEGLYRGYVTADGQRSVLLFEK